MLEFSTETKLTPSRSTGIYTFDENMYNNIVDAHKLQQSAHRTPIFLCGFIFSQKRNKHINTARQSGGSNPKPECAAQQIVFSRILREIKL